MNAIPITYNLPCPHCGQETRREWFQPSLSGKCPPMQSTDCLNENCEFYYRTLSVAEFMAQKEDKS